MCSLVGDIFLTGDIYGLTIMSQAMRIQRYNHGKLYIFIPGGSQLDWRDIDLTDILIEYRVL